MRSVAFTIVGLAAVAWIVVARVNQSNCGCGRKGVETALSRLGVSTASDSAVKIDVTGLNDLLTTAVDAVSGTAKDVLEHCASPLSSSVCATACWMGGNDIQRKFWWECLTRREQSAGPAVLEGLSSLQSWLGSTPQEDTQQRQPEHAAHTGARPGVGEADREL
jgi:hypothetical protein